MNNPDTDKVLNYLKQLQDEIVDGFSEVESKPFLEDVWHHANGGGGRTRVIEAGEVLEKGGVNFSHVRGDRLPDSATASRPEIAGKPFEAMGVSLVIHPRNPNAPTSHMNVRFFVADGDSGHPVWWFGGGFDLTPYYGFTEDCVHWHKTAHSACDVLGEGSYDKYKKWCDEYFFLKHRNEARGIGGIFFDDLNQPDFDTTFQFLMSVGNSYLQAYLPILKRRVNMPFDAKMSEFQRYRRGRYVEFNLVYDRGTLFGLQSGGRTESILMSLPPAVEWRYNWQAAEGSPEAELVNEFLTPKDWVNTGIPQE